MKRTRTIGFALLLAGGVWGVPSCASRTSAGSGTDSSTHWLDQCRSDADCGGLSCECSVCTKPCSERTDCSALSSGATCAPVPGCSSAASVCLGPGGATTPGNDAATPSMNGACPSGAEGGAACDGTIGQCWLPCMEGGHGQLVCTGGKWNAGKGIFPCSDGTCPDTVQGGEPCDASVEQCWTGCVQGMRGQFVCSDGTWLAGHGLYPCGSDAGSPTGSGGSGAGGAPSGSGGAKPIGTGGGGATSTDAGESIGNVSTSCKTSGDCYAADRNCCGYCGVSTVQDKIGIAVDSKLAYRTFECSLPVACPPCEAWVGTVDAFCRASRCEVEDLAQYKACTKDADCKLVAKDCCACGTLPATAFVSISDESSYQEDRCGAVDCVVCQDGPHVADATSPTCNTVRGYCEMAPPR